MLYKSEITNSNNLAKPNILMISAVYLVMNVYDTVSYNNNNNNNNMQTIAIVKKYFLFFLILIFALIAMYKLSGFEASAISPSFSLQVINDSRNDWIDWTRKYSFEKDGSIDITRADYFSNGKTLNATIWLACEPKRSSYIDPLSQCNKNNIQISVENLGSKNNITLNEYTNRTINKLNESLVNQIQSSEDTILAGNNPAHKIVYTTTVYGKQQDFETLQIWTVKDGKAYIIEYTATPANYANYKPIIQNMINSFDIGNIQKRSANIINANYSSYQNNTYGIKISYPRNWQLQQQQNGDNNNNYGIYNDGNTTTHIVTFFPRTLNSVTYGMYVDADNNNKTGILAGIDYIFGFNKADNDKSWNKQIQQWATPTVFRIIDSTDNYTGLFGRFPGGGQEEGSINLSVNLDAIGSPDNYRVIFFAKKGNATDVSDRVGDYTNWALIPPSKLEISVLPNPSEIRQEESKKVELQLKSNTAFDSQTRTFIKKTPGIDIEYNSNLVQIPPFGLATIPLNIIVSGNADIGPQTIPVSINSSFPTEVYQESSYSTSGFVNLGFKVPSTEANIVNQTSDFTVEVQKRLDAGQKIAAFWKDFGGPISLIGGGFVGGFSGWIIGKVQRKESKK